MKRILLVLLVLGMVGLSRAITYVDADFTAGSGNTLYAPSAGGGMITTNTTDTADGLWRFRAGFGLSPTDIALPTGPIATGGSGTIYESTGNVSPSDNVPRVVTTITGLAMNTYNVYIYFWMDQAGSPWRIRAGLADAVEPLPLFIGSNTITPADWPISWVGSDTAGRRLLQAYLGQVTGTSLNIFVEDAPAASGIERTWYDGIGYEAIPEPATMAILGLGTLLLRRKQ